MLGFRVAATLQLITRFSDPSRPHFLLCSTRATFHHTPRTPKHAVSFNTGSHRIGRRFIVTSDGINSHRAPCGSFQINIYPGPDIKYDSVRSRNYGRTVENRNFAVEKKVPSSARGQSILPINSLFPNP